MPESFLALSLNQFYAALFGYLLGSIPFGLLLTRGAGLGDIRNVGSGSVGATNVLRTGRKGIAAFTLLLDMAKGAGAVVVAVGWGADVAIWAGLFSVLGHNFPVWLKFQGGKGVATTFGVLVALQWPIALLCFATWLIVAALFRISSLAALVALAAAPAFAVWLGDANLVALMGILALLGIARHHANIRRLYHGEEARIGSGG